MRSNPWCVRASAMVVVATFSIAALTTFADELDDAIASVKSAFGAIEQNEYEVTYGARVAKNGKLYFLDQTHFVGKALSKEKGWTVPEKKFTFKPPLEAGAVFWSTWSSGAKAEPDPAATIVVWRYPHAAADGKTDLTTKFGDPAIEVPNKDAQAIVTGLFKEWTAELEAAPAGAPAEDPAPGAPADPAGGKSAPAEPKPADSDRQEWTEPVKKQAGIAKIYAAAQGRTKAGKPRERREWFAWTGQGATWVVCARYPEAVLSKTNAARSKGAYFTNAVRRED